MHILRREREATLLCVKRDMHCRERIATQVEKVTRSANPRAKQRIGPQLREHDLDGSYGRIKNGRALRDPRRRR